jgi:hypothetical protein
LRHTNQDKQQTPALLLKAATPGLSSHRPVSWSAFALRLLSTSLDADRAIAKKEPISHLHSSTRHRLCLSPASRQTMAGFSAQPDEGYSEDPLNPLSTSASFSFKNREDAVSALASVRSGEFPAWLTQHISNLSMSRKTGMSFGRLFSLLIVSGPWCALHSPTSATTVLTRY